MRCPGVTLALILLALASARGEDSAEDKALAYLSREVPRWSTEHRCYSCHNNGDAARALYAAVRLGRTVKPEATADTDRWLGRPEGWEKNGGDGPFSDKALARVQFAFALASALEAGRVKDRESLMRASVKLAEDQDEDGSWKVDEENRVGSPATYGRPLATWFAREVLRTTDPVKYRTRVDRADVWLRQQPVFSVMDASTVLLARAFEGSAEGIKRRQGALDLLKRGQSPEGRLGSVRPVPARGIRHRAGPAGPRPPSRPARRLRDDQAGPSLPHLDPARRRVVDRDHSTLAAPRATPSGSRPPAGPRWRC